MAGLVLDGKFMNGSTATRSARTSLVHSASAVAAILQAEIREQPAGGRSPCSRGKRLLGEFWRTASAQRFCPAWSAGRRSRISMAAYFDSSSEPSKRTRRHKGPIPCPFDSRPSWWMRSNRSSPGRNS